MLGAFAPVDVESMDVVVVTDASSVATVSSLAPIVAALAALLRCRAATRLPPSPAIGMGKYIGATRIWAVPVRKQAISTSDAAAPIPTPISNSLPADGVASCTPTSEVGDGADAENSTYEPLAHAE